MKQTHKILTSAFVFALGLSVTGATGTEQEWFTVDFESGYTVGEAVTAGTATGGAWAATEGDASTVVDTTPATSKAAKLATNEGTLTWTPSAESTGEQVLLDAKVYMVGSADAPAKPSGDAQTEVYLNNSGDTAVLMAHVAVGDADQWVQLQGQTITDESWIDLRISINYDALPSHRGVKIRT